MAESDEMPEEETQQEEMKRDERDDYITIEEANK